jgi:hypothetical protein
MMRSQLHRIAQFFGAITVTTLAVAAIFLLNPDDDFHSEIPGMNRWLAEATDPQIVFLRDMAYPELQASAGSQAQSVSIR